jgi:MFS family permease
MDVQWAGLALPGEAPGPREAPQVLAGPAFIVTFTISGVLMGFLADRVSRPRLLAGCTALLATCTILTGLSTTYWQLLLLRSPAGSVDLMMT